MPTSDLDGILDFLRHAERLKDVTRSGFTSEGRSESVAEHSWRLCLMSLVLAESFPEVDHAKLVKMCIVHDLGEAIHGDVPAIEQSPGESKSEQERQDLLQLLAPLPVRLRSEITELWDEYEGAATPEARLAKGLDKLETILQHTQGQNPEDFDYAFNLGYGKQYTSEDPRLAALREILDRETARRAEESSRRGASRAAGRLSVEIAPVTVADSDSWLRQRCELWPDGSPAEHRRDIDRFFSGAATEPQAVLLARRAAAEEVGFVELSIRPFAEGCRTQRVAYLEGWYVVPGCRGRGVGRALVEAAAAWGRSRGCAELASDTETHNEVSRLAHRALGFEEAGQIRCFRRDL